MDKDYADKILEYKNDIKADVLKEVNRIASFKYFIIRQAKGALNYYLLKDKNFDVNNIAHTWIFGTNTYRNYYIEGFKKDSVEFRKLLTIIENVENHYLYKDISFEEIDDDELISLPFLSKREQRFLTKISNVLPSYEDEVLCCENITESNFKNITSLQNYLNGIEKKLYELSCIFEQEFKYLKSSIERKKLS